MMHETVAPATATHEHVCEVCSTPFTAKRADARTCSTRCRVKAHRKAKAPKSPLPMGRGPQGGLMPYRVSLKEALAAADAARKAQGPTPE